MKVAGRIRDTYNKLGFQPTSLSIGVALFLSKTGDVDKDIDDMVQRSDRALYYAKHNLGGNDAHLDEESARFHPPEYNSLFSPPELRISQRIFFAFPLDTP